MILFRCSTCGVLVDVPVVAARVNEPTLAKFGYQGFIAPAPPGWLTRAVSRSLVGAWCPGCTKELEAAAKRARLRVVR
jgi:hypothetical protein